MDTNESLASFDERLNSLMTQNKRIPQVVLTTLPRLRMYSGRELSDISLAECEKLVAKIDSALLVAEEKKVATTIHISEKWMSEDVMLKKAGIYAQKKVELLLLEENYQRRKEELIQSMSDAESKIPLAQMGEFSALVKQISE